MKIKFFGEKSFLVHGKTGNFFLNPPENCTEKCDFAIFSETEKMQNLPTKKIFSLPCEAEISEILIHGIFSSPENVVFKILVDGVSCVHFGELLEIPSGDFFEKLGEKIDIIFLPLSENFDAKKAKNLIDQIDPRAVFFCGDSQFFPEISKNFKIQNLQNSTEISRQKLSDEKTEIFIFSEN